MHVRGKYCKRVRNFFQAAASFCLRPLRFYFRLAFLYDCFTFLYDRSACFFLLSRSTIRPNRSTTAKQKQGTR